MADSPADRAHDALVAGIADLGQDLGGTALSVIKGKVPKASEVDRSRMPVCYVAPSVRQGRDEPFDSGGANGRSYREHLFDVVFLAAGNRDNVAGLPDYQQWRNRVSVHYAKPKPTELFDAVPELLHCRVEPGVVVDRDAFAVANMDLSALTIRVCCVEEN